MKIAARAARRGLGDDTSDRALVGGQDAGGAITITGQAPPATPSGWWWVLGIAALALGWWMVRDDVEKEGRRLRPRPLAA